MELNSCYMYSDDTMPQAQALEWCRNAGGYLAAVTSEEERNALYAHTGIREYWIDGTDVVTEGQWYLQTGELLTYTGFVAPQPNGGAEQNCRFMEMNKVGDRICANYTGVLCEQDIYY